MVDLELVGQGVTIGVLLQRVRLVRDHLLVVTEPVEVCVLRVRVRLVFRRLVQVGQPVPVAVTRRVVFVGRERIGPKEKLLVITEPVAVGVGLPRIGSERGLVRVNDAVPIAVHGTPVHLGLHDNTEFPCHGLGYGVIFPQHPPDDDEGPLPEPTADAGHRDGRPDRRVALAHAPHDAFVGHRRDPRVTGLESRPPVRGRQRHRLPHPDLIGGGVPGPCGVDARRHRGHIALEGHRNRQDNDQKRPRAEADLPRHAAAHSQSSSLRECFG